MTFRQTTQPTVRLNVPHNSPPLLMPMDRFFEFSFWMAEELLDLEAEFARWQTPASMAPRTFDANGLPDDAPLQFDC